ncbi:MAG: ADP-ribosylglycohydrolase family protein, partial [Paramuribaculum sp.]|nr:ADP-ribosylglycohydrolase family protein [Paramuribaculum sp.]MDE6322791.1 ADP-ribosylglycohydrolase family protein [Paramuribaculum sp.]
VGGAVGDALGYPVEFVCSFEEIRAKLKTESLSYPWLEDYLGHYKALFSDGTQMTLYSAEGLLEAERSGMQQATSSEDFPKELINGYENIVYLYR